MQGGTEGEGGDAPVPSPRGEGHEGREYIQPVQRQEDTLAVAARPYPREIKEVVGVYQHRPREQRHAPFVWHGGDERECGGEVA